jgi:lipopolysaccharide/colanic/teichoic acid biosynthesis glycosyltransferase
MMPQSSASPAEALAAAYPIHSAAGLLPRTAAYPGKRILDLTIATLALVVLLPVCPFIFLAIRLDSAGPALFRQVRVGKDGHPFVMFKFRTMQVRSAADPDPTTRAIMERWMAGTPVQTPAMPATAMSTGKRHATSHPTAPPYKLTNDSRITRVGRVLRKTSLDEFPQLLNVLRGEMSLVGPRPPLLVEMERYTARALARLRVKPGITGRWQVEGRGWMSFDEMLELDLAYGQHCSLRQDVSIMLHTIPAVLGARGAG